MEEYKNQGDVILRKDIKLVFIIICLVFLHSAFAKTSTEMRTPFNDEIAINFGYDYRVESTQLMYSRLIDNRTSIGFKAGEGRSRKEKQTSLALQAKLFKGDSFYIAPEIFYINHLDTEHQENESLVHIGAGIRLGNQFQMNNFSFGIDWIGIGKGLIIIENDYTAKPYTISLLNTYIGFAF